MSALRGLFVWPPPQPTQGRGPWEQEPEGSHPLGRKGGPARIRPKEAPPLARGSLHRTPSLHSAQAGPRALRKHASRAESEREEALDPKSFPLAPPPPHRSRGAQGSHSPIGILVVDVESLCGAQELWGSEQEASGHPRVIRPHPHPNPVSFPAHLPNPADLLVCRKAPAPWPFGGLSLWPSTPAHWPVSVTAASTGSCCSSGLAVPGPQPSSFIEPSGRRRGDWHAMPSMDRPTSAWLAFLPEWAKE